jgi:hypothetical protein
VELSALVLDQQVMEAVGADDQPDQCPIGFRGRRERIGVVDHHPHFLAGAAQMHRMAERESWLVIERIRGGCGEAIIEQCCEPTRAEMDGHLVETHIDPLDQGEEG